MKRYETGSNRVKYLKEYKPTTAKPTTAKEK